MVKQLQFTNSHQGPPLGGGGGPFKVYILEANTFIG